MNIFARIFGNTSSGFDKEKIRKVIIIRVFSYLAMISLIVFGTLRLVAGENTAAIFDYSIFTIIFLNFLFHIIAKKIKTPAYIVVSLVFILMLGIFLVIGKGGTGLYWYYIFPLFSIFLLGNKSGITYSLSLLAITIYFLIFPPEFAIRYPDGIITRIVFTYLLVLGLTATYEYVRYKTRKAFVKMYEEKSKYLDETIQQKEEILSINEVITEQKQKLESSYEYINNSINYAKVIQKSLLTKKELIEKFIPGKYFLYFKPKDIVSGDFYYVNEIDNSLIFAIADCTGHGVAGGFITMLAITHLHRILTDVKVKNPGLALNFLREKIKGNFHDFGSNSKTGLDIALCSVNLDTNELLYAGAYLPLVILRNNEIIEHKGTKNPIGFYPKEVDFETQSVKLQKGDIIYLFSDGYLDQIGGEANRKFSKSKFLTLLNEIKDFPMEKQKKYIDAIINKWKGNNKQIDDMSVLGIRWEN